MKKIVAFMLVIGCMLAFASCNLIPGFGGDDKDDDVVDYEAIAAIQATIDASAPDIAQISVVHKSSFGELNGEYVLSYNEDGSAIVNYTYELFNSFEEGSVSDGIKSEYTGVTVVSPDGTVVDELGGIASVEAITFDITLDADKLKDVVVTTGSISAKVAKADTLTVLGVALGYDADIVITVGTNGVASVSISYVTASGTVDIASIYTYIIEEEPAEGEEEPAEGEEEPAEGEDAAE